MYRKWSINFGDHEGKLIVIRNSFIQFLDQYIIERYLRSGENDLTLKVYNPAS